MVEIYFKNKVVLPDRVYTLHNLYIDCMSEWRSELGLPHYEESEKYNFSDPTFEEFLEKELEWIDFGSVEEEGDDFYFLDNILTNRVVSKGVFDALPKPNFEGPYLDGEGGYAMWGIYTQILKITEGFLKVDIIDWISSEDGIAPIEPKEKKCRSTGYVLFITPEEESTSDLDLHKYFKKGVEFLLQSSSEPIIYDENSS